MEKYIVVQTVVEMNNLPPFKKVQGLLVYCAETRLIYILDSGDIFRIFKNTKSYSFTADNFINLTVYHNLNTTNIDIMAYDYDNGVKVNLEWKLGTGFNKPYEVVDGFNAVTITASEIIPKNKHIYITIMGS